MNYFKTLLLAAALLAPALPASAQTVVKFATLAPEGSTWMKAMRQFTKETTARTDGRVKFKIYAGGFTGLGIGEVAPEVRLLDTPFLFKNAAEIDHIYKALDADFRKFFENRGYVLLGWAEVGTVNVFSNSPVTKPEDLRDVKMWIWEGDPIAEATFQALHIKPIPLSITDVMTSLQTGMINGVYGSPLSVIALQWFARMKYVFSLPLTNASGAVLISKKSFDTLSKDDQKVMLELGEKHMRALTLKSRKENEESVGILKKKGLIFTDPASPSVITDLEAAGQAARVSLVGKLYSRELLEKVEKELKEFRAPKKK